MNHTQAGIISRDEERGTDIGDVVGAKGFGNNLVQNFILL